MARDRQRAKQRRARRAAQNPGPAPTEPHRANVPGELEHASGEVEEFNAALVAGAGGRDDGEGDPADTASAVGATSDSDARGRSYVDEELEEEAVDEAELERQAAEAAPAPSRRERAAAAEPSKGLIGRFLAFLRASWAELQRVQWPDRRQVAQATAVVIGFVIVAGVYLGVADKVAQEVVDLII